MQTKRKYPIKEEKFKKLVEPYLRQSKQKMGRPTKISNYKFFCGVLYVLRTGVPWRDLPEEYGNWHTIYTRYKRWSENGFFWKLLHFLQSLKEILIDVVFIDGSIVPLHKYGGGALKKHREQSTGRGRKGLGTTMHIAINNNACVACELFPAQRQDCKSFKTIESKLPWNKINYLVADKGYDTANVRKIIKSNGATAVIPTKGFYATEDSSLTNEDFYDVKLYRKRNIIERFFGRLKDNKRIAMRFDKMDHTFLSFIALAITKLYKLLC
ncbi:MAG: IS5 family transposase [Rickettsiaceae bacterium]